MWFQKCYQFIMCKVLTVFRQAKNQNLDWCCLEINVENIITFWQKKKFGMLSTNLRNNCIWKIIMIKGKKLKIFEKWRRTDGAMHITEHFITICFSWSMEERVLELEVRRRKIVGNIIKWIRIRLRNDLEDLSEKYM